MPSNLNLPPHPGNDWKAWALQLLEFLNRSAPRAEVMLPEAIQLAHQIGGERATTDGILMYSPELGEPVYSRGGSWHKCSDGSPVLLRQPRPRPFRP